MFKVLALVTRPHLAVLGEVPGTGVHRNVKQYRHARTEDGILALRIDAPVLFYKCGVPPATASSPGSREYEEEQHMPVTVSSPKVTSNHTSPWILCAVLITNVAFIPDSVLARVEEYGEERQMAVTVSGPVVTLITPVPGYTVRTVLSL